MSIYNPIDIWYYFSSFKGNILSQRETEAVIAQRIIEGKPFFAGRLGMTETSTARIFEFKYKDKYQKMCDQLYNWSGFFPNDIDKVERFVELEKSTLTKVDLLQTMHCKGENYFVKKYCKADTIFTNSLACWDSSTPWTYALEGKKILVIHPFSESIEAQYKKRELLFPKTPTMLPEFELKTIKAVQTLADEKDNRFSDWFEALEWMCQQTLQIDYDVAIIGCGAYGFALGAFCKSQGKIAIQMGGDVQMHFGIMGERWTTNPWVVSNVNENWVRPSVEERPDDSNIVEGACYW